MIDMRILMLGSKEYPFGSSKGHDPKAGGGIEVHVEKLSNHLAKHGHEVFIITRRFPGQPKEETHGKIHIYRTGFVSNPYLRTFTFNLSACLKAMKMIKETGIDLIHSHGVLAGLFGSKLSMATGVPMAFTPHGTLDEWGFPIRHILKLLRRVPLRFAKRILFISPMEMESMKTRNPAVLLTNGIDFEDCPKTKKTWRGVRFLFLGRLEEFKGVKLILEAFKKISRDFPEAELYIAGEGEMKSWINKFIEENGMKSAKVLGWADPKDILPKTDVFLLPSTERGQPIALLEAMATGRIIITSLGYIEDGKTGLKTKPDVQNLYEKMLVVCRNPKKYEKLGENARKSVQNLSWSKVVNDFEKEYNKILSE
jgi:glycosyltransferase involved in cell wall biosynthesis